MNPLRAFLRRHLALCALLAATALALRVVVPAGVMVGTDSRTITVTICHGTGEAASRVLLAIPATHGHQDIPGGQPKGECAFGALSMVSLALADPVLLAAALAFILTLGLGPVIASSLSRVAHLRPPLRGPPAPA